MNTRTRKKQKYQVIESEHSGMESIDNEDKIQSGSESNKDSQEQEESSSQRVIEKQVGKVWSHITKNVDADEVIFSCNYCTKTWSQSFSHWKSKGSVTSNFTRHTRSSHKQFVNGIQKIEPMDSFIGGISKLRSCTPSGEVSDAMIGEAIENLIMHDCHPFDMVESEHFVQLLRVCLNCSRKDVHSKS